MVNKLRSTWAEIDLNALSNNIREVKRVCNGKDIIAVIKADGYGHGAIDIYKELIEYGANKLAVAVITEAIEIRRTGTDIPIMILGFTSSEFYDDVIDFNVEQTIYSYEDAKCLSNVAVRKKAIAKIHIAVDTGMGRIGFLTTMEQAKEVHRITKLPGINIVGIFTHFATADEHDKDYTNIQIEKFNWFNNYLESLGVDILFKHVSNSAAIIDFPGLNYQGVRAGIMLYGYYPSDNVDKNKVNIIPVMTVKSRIVHIKKLEAGESVSYGRVFTTKVESIIGTLPIGYADGLSRLLTGKSKVIINGKFAPIVGKICMDQCMVDLTDIPNVEVGDEIILIGKDKYGNVITADDVGRLIGTISYEIICDISKRVPRIYTKDGEIVSVRNYI